MLRASFENKRSVRHNAEIRRQIQNVEKAETK